MIMFAIIQLLAVLFSVAVAKHDAPAVNHFENYGFSSDKQLRDALRQFHNNNWWLKFFFCAGVAVPAIPNWIEAVCSGLLAGLWVYLLFDIVLNLNRPGRKWYYLGNNDKDGRFWIKLFGRNAGKIKVVILLILITSINLLKYLL